MSNRKGTTRVVATLYFTVTFPDADIPREQIESWLRMRVKAVEEISNVLGAGGVQVSDATWDIEMLEREYPTLRSLPR